MLHTKLRDSISYHKSFLNKNDLKLKNHPEARLVVVGVALGNYERVRNLGHGRRRGSQLGGGRIAHLGRHAHPVGVVDGLSSLLAVSKRALRIIAWLAIGLVGTLETAPAVAIVVLHARFRLHVVWVAEVAVVLLDAVGGLCRDEARVLSSNDSQKSGQCEEKLRCH